MSISISAWNRVILKSRIIFLAFLTLARLPLAPYMIFCYCPCNLCQSEFSVGNVILILVMHHGFFSQPYCRSRMEGPYMCNPITVFENHRKSRIQHCERSELCLHFKWTKGYQKCQKWSNFGEFQNE